MNEINRHVGSRIRQYRREAGLTLQQLADCIHKSRASVSKYETGEITVNGNAGTWIDSTEGMYHHIRWQENGWWYEIGGETELEELIRMAESIGPTRYRKESDYPEKN